SGASHSAERRSSHRIAWPCESLTSAERTRLSRTRKRRQRDHLLRFLQFAICIYYFAICNEPRTKIRLASDNSRRAAARASPSVVCGLLAEGDCKLQISKCKMQIDGGAHCGRTSLGRRDYTTRLGESVAVRGLAFACRGRLQIAN